MNMQQMMMQAQKMQRELAKAINELNAKEFTVSKGGAVSITMLGNHEITSINIEEDALEKENKEMIEDMIKMAINEAIALIEKEKGDINERITGSRTGLGM